MCLNAVSKSQMPPCAENEKPLLLVIAHSGRMLAVAARKAGYRVLVIDVYADLDTCAAAVAVTRVNSLAVADIQPAVDGFIAQYGVGQLVYGSGFEYHPESLVYLARHLTIIGNQPATFARLLDKPDFFAALRRLAIAHPETRFVAPETHGDWLVKPSLGQGGVGVCHYHAGMQTQGVYWQRYRTGQQHSVLFLAAAGLVNIIGFNRQWAVAVGQLAFMFAGICNASGLADVHQRTVLAWLEQLVAEFGLVGINSMDFIVDDQQLWLLEINPRPSASMQLYDASLFARHCSAVQGELRACPPAPGVSAMQIVYAPKDLTIPAHFVWPDGCQDLPAAGTQCLAGQPLCSIMAHSPYARGVYNALLTTQRQLLRRLLKDAPSPIPLT